MNNFEKVLEEKKAKVWPVISSYLEDPSFPDVFRVPVKYRNDREKYWKIVREYPERKGKYVRPSLVLLTAEAMGVPEFQVLLTAAAMQVSEDWLLIHDDFEDKSQLRRGKPVLHRMYGEELAVNAGDALQVIMWKMLIDNEKILGWQTAKKIMEEFYVMLSRTALGQGIELDWAKTSDKLIGDDDWFFVADGKTSYYSIAGPMRLGAILADATTKQLEQLAEFGQALGRCYQLVDDVLDITSDFRGLKGKIAYNDIYESKKTLLIGHLLRTVNQKERKKIVRILSKPRHQKSADEVLWIVGRMKQAGSVNYARRVAKELAAKSKGVFERKLTFLLQNKGRDDLDLGISFILNRDY